MFRAITASGPVQWQRPAGCVAFEIPISNQRSAFLAALREYLPTVRGEDGTLQYDVCEAESSAATFLSFEAYPNDAASRVQQETDAFNTYIEKIGPMLEEPPITLKLLESAKA